MHPQSHATHYNHNNHHNTHRRRELTPRSTESNYDGGGIVDPKDAINAVFPRGTIPMRGSLGTHASIEEDLIRSIAAGTRVAGAGPRRIQDSVQKDGCGTE